MVDILVTGKKISDMDLVTEVKGDEKIPTDAIGDLAVSPDQLVEYVVNNTLRRVNQADFISLLMITLKVKRVIED